MNGLYVFFLMFLCAIAQNTTLHYDMINEHDCLEMNAHKWKDVPNGEVFLMFLCSKSYVSVALTIYIKDFTDMIKNVDLISTHVDNNRLREIFLRNGATDRQSALVLFALAGVSGDADAENIAIKMSNGHFDREVTRKYLLDHIRTDLLTSTFDTFDKYELSREDTEFIVKYFLQLHKYLEKVAMNLSKK